ncbi:hypothetical protein BDF22DRAFT_725506 [Syncephalis plumigaleata]|nr:hypothetical protein BDF22DRAFT_725506 [Syncephalis plumigaleata]
MTSDTIRYLRTLGAVRDRCQKIYTQAQADKLEHFELHEERIPAAVAQVAELIRTDYKTPLDVPPHSRFRSFEAGGVDRLAALLKRWSDVDALEHTRRLLDLCVISVLLDAGAGDRWRYHEASTGQTMGRTEGLGLAALSMFEAGAFSSDPQQPYQADAVGLQRLTQQQIEEGFQVTEDNPLVGVTGRHQLLVRLGRAIAQHPAYFTGNHSISRPGNLVDYLLGHSSTKHHDGHSVVATTTLWDAIMNGMQEVWPATRTRLDGQSMGDVWPCGVLASLAANTSPDEQLVPFHKLSQWLTYSIMEPMQNLCHIQFEGQSTMTGLPEYRNGGLLVDHQIITLREASMERGLARALAANYNLDANGRPTVPYFSADDPVIVEWRALTICLIDKVAQGVRAELGLSEAEFPLPMVLEGGTWKAGRRIAAEKRPDTCGPPIAIESDGTVF